MNMHSSLIDAQTLADLLTEEDLVIVDCRYDLLNPSAGKKAYLQSHIAGAVYASLDDDLSGPPITNKGRHPILTEEGHNALFSRLGVSLDKQVVVYDASEGAFAARLWWMLRYLGQHKVAVLDGGWSAWEKRGGAVVSGEEHNQSTVFSGSINHDAIVKIEDVMRSKKLVDSREPARYRGEIEPIDRIAGHIPGALNRYYRENLQDNGYFKEKKNLQSEFKKLSNEKMIEELVFYCGSGVTACHNLLACYHAFAQMPKLYAGSWSEWSSQLPRSVETSLE